jgi:glycosyltransferase involved in cell wall biosynthesis
MTASSDARDSAHVLIYEPRVEGHHISYLKFVTEDLLASGYQLTLAIDLRPEPIERIRSQLGELLDGVKLMPVFGEDGRLMGNGRVDAVARCLAQARADLVFLDSFDEIASALVRRAAFGLVPPPGLRGRLGGIYLRPRFLSRRGFSPNLWMKAFGFGQLLRRGWFSHLLLLDPFLASQLQRQRIEAPIFPLPDPYPEAFAADRALARKQWAVPEERLVFLFYGTAYRRKGLPLTVEAMLGVPQSSPAYLLCAGQQHQEPRVVRGLATLAQEGRALVINRYVSVEEERQLFAACDVVLLPYIRHFGSSGVLSRAVGAGKPVIASDEELVGRIVRERGLGLLFPSGDARALSHAIKRISCATVEEMSRWHSAARAYAPHCSRVAFRSALLEAFDHAVRKSRVANR